MRIEIKTFPCVGNYGGMLQAYALSMVLNEMRLEVCYQNMATDFVNFIYSQPLSKIKAKVKHVLYGMGAKFILPPFSYQYIVGCKFVRSFFSNVANRNYNLIGADAFLVGSDQVWRKSYAKPADVAHYFLDFATPKQRACSVSYAASFGSDEWEGTPEETEECGRLLREFKAVSVREHSGVKICKEVFGVDAVQMPDPTLLLHTSDYEKIIDSEKTWLPESKYVAAYVLDETAGKAELLQEGAEALNLQLQHLMPHATAKKRRDRFPISVPQWLRLIRDCEYFITDSFHGCVFAIIYNKPFVCLGNAGRGNARFDTLLGTFGLEDRMVTHASPEEIQRVLNTPIDWERVNAIHDAERERGINFLKENLL